MKVRKERRLTQDQLAVASNIDSSNVRSYESGRAMMSIPTLIKLAEALRTPPGHFLDGVTRDMLP